jgi:hypothetical protein
LKGQFKGSNEQESKKRRTWLQADIHRDGLGDLCTKLCCSFLVGVKHTPKNYFARNYLLQEGCSMIEPRPNCPDNDVLQELAAGILAPAMAEQTMLHVAECKLCGPILRQYLREFSDEQSPENISILKQLQSSKPEWQKKLVRKLIGGARRFPWLKLVPATAALAAVIFGFVEGPSLWTGFQVGKAQSAIGATFAGRRTTLSRLPNVGYAPYDPFPTKLGGEDGPGLDEVPPSLHEASGAANKNIQAGNADPRWLQIQGRALLWESTPSNLEKAAKDFEKARSEG